MTESRRIIYVYVFKKHESYTTQDYVRISAKEYCNMKKDSPYHGETFSEDLFIIDRTPLGKPYFRNRTDICFSVSHSGDHVVCAFFDGEIGVDIELMGRLSDESDEMLAGRLCRIADRFFHPREAALIRTDPLTRFYEIFTAKESFVKYTGTGFDETLGEISVLPNDGPMQSCHSESGIVQWRSDKVEFLQTKLDSGYTLCVCTAYSDGPCELCIAYLYGSALTKNTDIDKL